VRTGTVKRCRGCEQKPQCTRGKFRTIAIHTCEAARQKADEVAKTPEFAVALRKRRKVEALFSKLKNLVAATGCCVGGGVVGVLLNNVPFDEAPLFMGTRGKYRGWR
jgi:Transposase DDE domain